MPKLVLITNNPLSYKRYIGKKVTDHVTSDATLRVCDIEEFRRNGVETFRVETC